MPKSKAMEYVNDREHYEVLHLQGLDPELDSEGNLRITLPTMDFDPRILRDLAVDMGVKTPDALADRLFHVIREYTVTEALAGRISATER